jgi:drug/metabolite transporter (DMT)-like permease
MTYLILSILLSSSIFIIFRYFTYFRVNNFQAITFNYVLASFMGLAFFSGNNNIVGLFDKPWLYLGIIEGVLFITVFIFFAYSSQKAGVGITAVASKMSVVIPVIFGIILYGDSVRWLKITGIILALLAFYLSLKKNGRFINNRNLILLPLLLFLGNGSVDTLLKITEHFYLTTDKGFFLASVFLTALIIGSSITVFNISFRKEKLEVKNILGGFLLGSVNYLTTYFTLLALEFMESSIYYPLHNSGIVALTAFLGILLFKERYSVTNWVGIILTIIAIVLISL